MRRPHQACQPTSGAVGAPPRVLPAHKTSSFKDVNRTVNSYTVRCPRCKSIERVKVRDINWSGPNHKVCSLCGLPIKVTSDQGFLQRGVRPHYKEVPDGEM